MYLNKRSIKRTHHIEWTFFKVVVFLTVLNNVHVSSVELCETVERDTTLCKNDMPHGRCRPPQSKLEVQWSKLCFRGKCDNPSALSLCVEDKDTHTIHYICMTFEEMTCKSGDYGKFTYVPKDEMIFFEKAHCPDGFYTVGRHDCRKPCSQHLDVDTSTYTVIDPGSIYGDAAMVECNRENGFCPVNPEFGKTFSYSRSTVYHNTVCSKIGPDCLEESPSKECNDSIGCTKSYREITTPLSIGLNTGNEVSRTAESYLDDLTVKTNSTDQDGSGDDTRTIPDTDSGYSKTNSQPDSKDSNSLTPTYDDDLGQTTSSGNDDSHGMMGTLSGHDLHTIMAIQSSIGVSGFFVLLLALAFCYWQRKKILQCFCKSEVAQEELIENGSEASKSKATTVHAEAYYEYNNCNTFNIDLCQNDKGRSPSPEPGTSTENSDTDQEEPLLGRTCPDTSLELDLDETGLKEKHGAIIT